MIYRSSEELSMSEKPHHRAAYTADDMRKMGNVACGKKSAQDFLCQVKHTDGDKRQRDFTWAAAGGRGEEDQHVHNGGGAQQHGISAKEDVEKAGKQGSRCEHEQ